MALGILISCTFALAQQGAAQEASTPDTASADEDLFELEEQMVSTASRTSEPVRTAPASVTIVSRRELEAFGFLNTSDALRGVRGLYQTDDKFYTSLGVRGFNRFGDYGNRVQVQLDGHVMNDDWINSSYIGNDQFSDLWAIDSIEVVRGPGSALYGTGAFFGVVNLTLPRAAPSYSVRAGGGVVDSQTYRVHADGGHQFEGGPGFVLSTGMSTLPGRDYQSDAYRDTPWAPDGIAHGVDGFSTGTALGKAWWGDFTLVGSFHQRNRTMPTGHFGTVFGDVRNRADDRRGFLELRYEPTIADSVKLMTRAYVDHQGYFGAYSSTDPNFGYSFEDESSTWGGVEARVLLGFFGDALKLTPGVELQTHPWSRWVGVEEFQDHPYLDQTSSFHYLSAYLVSEWTPTSWLIVSGGARFDGWAVASATGTAYDEPLVSEPSTGFLWSLNPRAAVAWLPTEDDTLKLMAGRSYRVPSLYEFSYSVGGLDFTDGNPVEPETIYTAELEYRRRLPLDAVLVVATYGNLVNDLLNYITIDSLNVDGYENVDQPIVTLGAEAEVRRELAEGVLATAHVSVQDTRFDTPFTGNKVANSPTLLGAGSLVIPIGVPDVTLANRVLAEWGRLDRNMDPVDPAVRWDAMLALHPAALPVSLYAGVQNILDWRIVHPVSDRVRDVTLPQDGRTFRLEAFFRF